MGRYAVVVDGLVVNMVVWDGVTEWTPNEGKAIEAPYGVGIGWAYYDGEFTAPTTPELPHNELVAQAEQMKSSLLSAATFKIIIWNTKLLMGRKLTDEETSQLNAWMDYIDEVMAIDTDTAPYIKWPVSPDVIS